MKFRQIDDPITVACEFHVSNHTSIADPGFVDISIVGHAKKRDQCKLNHDTGCHLKNSNLRVGFARVVPVITDSRRLQAAFTIVLSVKPNCMYERCPALELARLLARYRRRSRVIAWAFIAHVALIIPKYLARVNHGANFATNERIRLFNPFAFSILNYEYAFSSIRYVFNLLLWNAIFKPLSVLCARTVVCVLSCDLNLLTLPANFKPSFLSWCIFCKINAFCDQFFKIYLYLWDMYTNVIHYIN